MEHFNNIQYSYNGRTKRWSINYINAGKVPNVIKKALTAVAYKNMFAKVEKNSFEIYDFFILELEFILQKIKDERLELAIEIGGSNLNNLLEFLRTKTWLAERYSNTKIKFDNQRLKTMMKFSPLPHQFKAYEKYEEIKKLNALRGFLMDAEAGAGKTYISLSLTELLDYDYKIIIAPRQTIETVWVKSIQEDLYKKPQSYIVLGQDRKRTYKKEKFIIMHYEYLEKLKEDKKLLRKLKKLKPAIIVDESHNFNEVTSKRTQNLLEVVNYINPKDIILLSGTPIKMSVNELIPILYILDTKFPPVVERFKSFYSALYKRVNEILLYRFGLYKERISKDKKTMPKIDIREYRVSIPNYKEFTILTIKQKIKDYKEKRLNEIYENYEKYENQFESLLIESYNSMIKNGISKTKATKLIRSYKSKVKIIKKHADRNMLSAIPTIILETREIEKQIESYLTPDGRNSFRDIKAIIKYPKLKVMGEALGKILLGNRIACYRELAKYLNYKELLELTPKKGLIFSNYVSVCNIAYEQTKKQGYKPVRVYDEFTTELNSVVKKFNNIEDPSNPLIATYKSLSTGVPLVASNIVICLDLPFRMYIFDQAIARAWRIGQDRDVVVFIIKLDSGEEFNITDRDHFIINMSEYNVELITGNTTPYEMPQQTLMSELEEDEEENDIPEEDEVIVEELEEEIIGVVGKQFYVNIPESFLNKIFKFIK